jgi:hypothetical protein
MAKLGLRKLAALLSLSFLFAPSAFSQRGPLLDAVHPAVRAVATVQHEVTDDWMRHPEVIGTAVVLDGAGKPALGVFIDQDARGAAEMVRGLPNQVRGVGVEIRLTDKFRALRRRRRRPPGGGGTGISHQSPQPLPIQLGTSGGWSKDAFGTFCCSGTLGAVVQIGGQQYILSNWHVLEDDLVPGKNNAVAQTGDAVLQPGLTDVNCNAGNATTVATLEVRNALPNNNVDCAIAKVNAGAVRTDGAILEVGTISSQTVSAAIGQSVKKSGRTTGVTHNVVTGLNGTISVAYEQECNGKHAFTKTFTGQILVGGGNGFLGDGDSGSLLVEDAAANPRAVGLCFAGSSRNAVANPINEVLAFLGASMVGN